MKVQRLLQNLEESLRNLQVGEQMGVAIGTRKLSGIAEFVRASNEVFQEEQKRPKPVNQGGKKEEEEEEGFVSTFGERFSFSVEKGKRTLTINIHEKYDDEDGDDDDEDDDDKDDDDDEDDDDVSTDSILTWDDGNSIASSHYKVEDCGVQCDLLSPGTLQECDEKMKILKVSATTPPLLLLLLLLLFDFVLSETVFAMLAFKCQILFPKHLFFTFYKQI